MSNKKYDHWCDKQYQNPEDKDGNKRYIIGELAHSNYATLEQYLLHDISKDMEVVFSDDTQGKISKDYAIQRLYRMLDLAEDIEISVYEANSCYALYDTDFKYRRDRWLKAKGLNQKDIREILADYFNVSLDQVINSKYSYIILEEKEKNNGKIHD